MIRRFALTVILATALAGCSDDGTGPGNNTSQYTNAKALWQAARPVRYSFVASRACECLPDAAGPVRIEVNGTSIVSVTHIHTDAIINPALWFSVDGLFDLIDEELRTRPTLLDAEYDGSNGHPTRVEYGNHEFDDGAIIQVSDFMTIVGGTAGYLRR
jgi:hypothetical protein